MKKRTQAREFAVQMMYQAEIMNDPESDPVTPADIIGTFWKSFEAQPKDVRDFSEELFRNTFPLKDEHDRMVAQFLKESWSLERLGEIEKCVLRVAIYELLNTSTPAYAVLDEYVTLTKRFTDLKTASFVNGLLEKVRNTFAADKKSKVDSEI